MAENGSTAESTDVATYDQNQKPDLDCHSDTSEDTSVEETYRDFQYGYRSSNCTDDEDDEEDPYQAVFMNAFRFAPASADEKDDGECTNNNINIPEAKPLCLMEDWDLWDYMDETELKERLKNHPQLLEEITRNRKRKLLDEEDVDKTDGELSEMVNRFAKYIRKEPANVTS